MKDLQNTPKQNTIVLVVIYKLQKKKHIIQIDCFGASRSVDWILVRCYKYLKMGSLPLLNTGCIENLEKLAQHVN